MDEEELIIRSRASPLAEGRELKFMPKIAVSDILVAPRGGA